MSRDYISIGSTPCEEECIGVGEPGARQECQIYARQLKREYPDGTFTMKAFPHDFGTYYEVVAWYGTFGAGDGEMDKEAMAAEFKAAMDAEGNAKPNWDEQALKELREQLGDWYFTEIRK